MKSHTKENKPMTTIQEKINRAKYSSVPARVLHEGYMFVQSHDRGRWTVQFDFLGEEGDIWWGTAEIVRTQGGPSNVYSVVVSIDDEFNAMTNEAHHVKGVEAAMNHVVETFAKWNISPSHPVMPETLLVPDRDEFAIVSIG